MTDYTRRDVAERPLRILEVETFGRGGLIHYAFNLSGALAGRGHEVTLVTTAAYELEDRGVPAGVRLVRIIARGTHRSARWLPAFARDMFRKVEALVDAWIVARLVRRLRPDVVHLHCTNQIALAYLILFRLLAVPVAVTAHVVTAHERTWLRDTVHRGIHRLSPLIIAHSEFDRKRLVEEFAVGPERVVVLPHGEYGFFARTSGTVARSEARRSIGLAEDDETALFFGYIREYKGLDVLLDAWPTILAARPRARLVIAGDPVQLHAARRHELQAAATRVGAIHRFEYVPFDEVTRYFAAADVLVLPYRHVSQSGVLLLALALGLPVVATGVGALAEVLRDGENALLVPPGSPGDLAAAVARALGDTELRARLAEGGRRVASQLSWPAIATQTEHAFATLLHRASHRDD